MFITFEGGEGAGKTSQIRRLAARLDTERRRQVLVTHEPGGSPLGVELRRLLLQPPPDITVDSRAELLMMLADRAQHVAQVILPHLDAGGTVLCDRYANSSVAYQGWGRGLDTGEITTLNGYATGGLMPRLTILLDIDPAVGLARQKTRTRMEDEALSFHRRVRDGFLALAGADPGQFLVIDATRPPDDVHAIIWSEVARRDCS